MLICYCPYILDIFSYSFKPHSLARKAFSHFKYSFSFEVFFINRSNKLFKIKLNLCFIYIHIHLSHTLLQRKAFNLFKYSFFFEVYLQIEATNFSKSNLKKVKCFPTRPITYTDEIALIRHIVRSRVFPS